MNRLEMQEKIATRLPFLVERDKDELKEAEALRRAFVVDYSPKKISALALDEYVIGRGGQNRSFCYRIERQMDDLGRITGSTAFKFGVYFGRTKSDASEKYRFSKRWGDSHNEAFSAVKEAVVELLRAANQDNWEAINQNRLSAMLKGKILFLYHPDKFAPIYAWRHLEHFITELNLSGSFRTEMEMQRALMTYRAGWPDLAAQSPILYMRLLYDIFGYPDYNPPQGGPSPSVVAPVLEAAVQGATFLDEMPVSGDVAKETVKRPRGKDYEEHQKRCKRIGDRGEKIVFELEQNRLRAAGRPDLASKVDQVSERDDSIGFDILSFDEDGTSRSIEVKATTARTLDGGFFISANELQKAKDLPNYYIYFVFSTMTRNPKIFTMRQPALTGSGFVLEPVAYHVTAVVRKDEPHLVVPTARPHVPKTGPDITITS